jgi:23S rRNA C2498 (ribose-2'-O)-methylase RlmM
MYIHNHKRYPAESFMKMKEMMALMRIDARGQLKDKRCIELGAAPGGWTMVMLDNEARVYSVDWCASW